MNCQVATRFRMLLGCHEISTSSPSCATPAPRRRPRCRVGAHRVSRPPAAGVFERYRVCVSQVSRRESGTWNTPLMHWSRAALLSMSLLPLGVGACSASDSSNKVVDTHSSYEIRSVSTAGSPEFYKWGAPAVLEIGMTSGIPYSQLTVPIQPKKKGGQGRGIMINPLATIIYGDGSHIECRETDLRRYPSVPGPEGGVVRLPCTAARPADFTTKVSILDQYEK